MDIFRTKSSGTSDSGRGPSSASLIIQHSKCIIARPCHESLARIENHSGLMLASAAKCPDMLEPRGTFADLPNNNRSIFETKLAMPRACQAPRSRVPKSHRFNLLRNILHCGTSSVLNTSSGCFHPLFKYSVPSFQPRAVGQQSARWGA